jgi:hypothetical protein
MLKPTVWLISNQVSLGDGERRQLAIPYCQSAFSFFWSSLMPTNSNTSGVAGGVGELALYGFMNSISRETLKLQVTIADEIERQLVRAIAAPDLESFPTRSLRGPERPNLQLAFALRYTSPYNMLMLFLKQITSSSCLRRKFLSTTGKKSCSLARQAFAERQTSEEAIYRNR